MSMTSFKQFLVGIVDESFSCNAHLLPVLELGGGEHVLSELLLVIVPAFLEVANSFFGVSSEVLRPTGVLLHQLQVSRL